jgi:hypothetical protein
MMTARGFNVPMPRQVRLGIAKKDFDKKSTALHCRRMPW